MWSNMLKSSIYWTQPGEELEVLFFTYMQDQVWIAIDRSFMFHYSMCIEMSIPYPSLENNYWK